MENIHEIVEKYVNEPSRAYTKREKEIARDAIYIGFVMSERKYMSKRKPRILLRLANLPIMMLMYVLIYIYTYIISVKTYILYGGEFILYNNKMNTRTISDLLFLKMEKKDENNSSE